jgi:hexosaminidase
MSTPQGNLSFDQINSIAVDRRFINAMDRDGETLIPPTLFEFAETFTLDLESLCGRKFPVVSSSEATGNAIFITIGDKSAFRDAAGRFTSEGYSLNITSHGIYIIGASPLGAWWGTRTILQQVVLGNQSMPLGIVTDSPGWRNRGVMVGYVILYAEERID